MDTFYWSTDYYHNDNAVTMDEYLNHYLSDQYVITLVEGTYAEILNPDTDEWFAVHASGNGDSFNHKVTFELL